jgi:hypothetical protein
VFPSDREAESAIQPDLQSPINARFHGGSRIDVFEIDGTHLDTIDNETDGEIINVNAASIKTINADFIGVGRNSTGARCAGREYPGSWRTVSEAAQCCFP